jgi:hypothetical protein
VPAALVAFMPECGVWEGTAKELLAALNDTLPRRHRDGDPTYPDEWPKRSNGLTNALRRAAPALRGVYGLDVDCDDRQSGGSSGGKLTRIVRIEPDGSARQAGCDRVWTPDNGRRAAGRTHRPAVPPRPSPAGRHG